MKTRAAVLRKAGTPWEITELELDPPKANEVIIRMEAAGLCHSDEHIRARGRARLPMAGGHDRHHRRRVLRHGAARRHSYRLPQENAGLFVRGRQSAVRHPNDPEPVAALATSSSRNSLLRNIPWTKLTRATKILWMVRTSAASSSTSTEVSRGDDPRTPGARPTARTADCTGRAKATRS